MILSFKLSSYRMCDKNRIPQSQTISYYFYSKENKKKPLNQKKKVLKKFQCELDIMFQSTFGTRLVCSKCQTVTSVNHSVLAQQSASISVPTSFHSFRQNLYGHFYWGRQSSRLCLNLISFDISDRIFFFETWTGI